MDAIARMCSRHGTSTEAAVLCVDARLRRSVYVLSWGAVSGSWCVSDEPPSRRDKRGLAAAEGAGPLLSPHGWTVAVVASGCAWVGRVERDDERDRPAYRFSKVREDGIVDPAHVSRLSPTPGAAFQDAFRSAFPNGVAGGNGGGARPNGKLFLGLHYPATQDKLRVRFASIVAELIGRETVEAKRGLLRAWLSWPSSSVEQRHASPPRTNVVAAQGRRKRQRVEHPMLESSSAMVPAEYEPVARVFSMDFFIPPGHAPPARDGSLLSLASAAAAPPARNSSLLSLNGLSPALGPSMPISRGLGVPPARDSSLLSLAGVVSVASPSIANAGQMPSIPPARDPSLLLLMLPVAEGEAS